MDCPRYPCDGPPRRNASGVIVNNPTSLKRRAFNVREFCAEYGIGHDNAYKAIREGKLIARKFGKRTIITVDDADRFIASLPGLELSRPADGVAQ